MTDPTVRTRAVRGGRGITGPIGQPVQNPLGDLDMSPEVALYVGTLEGQLAAYAVNEVKYRVLLELMTGESWYSTRVEVDTNVLADIATESLVRRGMDGTTARTVVNKRLSFGVEPEQISPVMPTPEATTESVDMATRFRSWKQRRGEEGGLPRRRQTGYVPPEIVVPPTTELVEPETVVSQGIPHEAEPVVPPQNSGPEEEPDQILGS